MPELRKYTINQSFLNDQGKIIHPEAEAARTEGYSDGYNSGLLQAKQEIEADIALTLDNMTEQLRTIANRQQEAYQFVTSSTLVLVKEIVEKLFPYLISVAAEKEVINFINCVLEKINSQGLIKIAIHPEVHPNIQSLIDEHQQHNKISCQINIICDETLDRRDCKITWDDGGVEFLQSTTQAEIDRLLQNLLDNVPNQPIKSEPTNESLIEQGEQNV